MTILISECKQEISSFNPQMGTYEDFVVTRGNRILDFHRSLRTEIGGALSVFEADRKLSLLAGYSARAITSGGLVTNPSFHRLAEEFLEPVRTAQGIDAVYYCLHGAFAAEGEPDVEGYLLARTREIVGPKIPIVISLDLHGILTDRMLSNCNAIAVYQTYPHVDFFETGEKAARLLLRILAKSIKPVMVRVPVPVLVRGDELITETGRFGRIVHKAREAEANHEALSAGMFIGNPFTDVPELGSNALVITDGNAELATRMATEMAWDLWGQREQLQATLTSLEDSVQIAAETSGRVILMDAADATSSGASGDSNAILTALVEAKCRRNILAPIVDPPAVEEAFRAGVGANIHISVGGYIDPARFRPLPLDARVTMLSDGRFHSESHGDEWNAGKTTVLKTENVTLVATTRAVHLYDRSLFLAHGLSANQFDVVVVKSPHCQHRFFNEGAARVICVDAPGSSSANLRSLGYRYGRSLYPLNEDLTWQPRPEIYPRDSRGTEAAR